LIAQIRIYLSFGLVLLTSLIFLSGCSVFDLRTYHTLRHLAGQNAIDCGVALFPANIPRVNACAIGASVEGVPFFFRYQLKHDPAINHGFVRTVNGVLLEVSVDGPQTSQRQDNPPNIAVCGNHALVPDPASPDLRLLTCNR
jgi:hypothetical protein